MDESVREQWKEDENEAEKEKETPNSPVRRNRYEANHPNKVVYVN